MNWQMIIVLGGLFVCMILFTVIPNSRRRKKQNQMMQSITTGDKVLTIGGFIGTVVEYNSDTMRYVVNIAREGDDEPPVNVVLIRDAIRNKI
ncbi:MAG: preprotein translocase subunit YajC [Christensenellaceae bacterium]|jgi:preprotein translocase YajC subunit|nr:preprotein translocase subunit YajC [Christensenellaceae bacterium]